VFDPRDPQAPCYHCLFPEADDVEALNCATTGVFAPLVGIIGSMQAAEALKIIAAIGTTLKGRLLILDALDMQWHSVKVKRDLGCIVCASRPHA
jgi:molybdopterin/thiamine biosynthesis adenylyltransferase